MSGKQSRERRLEAVRKAKADVYANNGGPRTNQPFDNERQARIYNKTYDEWQDHYNRMESLHDEMREIYGY